MEEERSDTSVKLSFGLIGDLADAFPSGQLKPLFLAEWVASELRSRARMPAETKKTMRWAREVRCRSKKIACEPAPDDAAIYRWLSVHRHDKYEHSSPFPPIDLPTIISLCLFGRLPIPFRAKQLFFLMHRLSAV